MTNEQRQAINALKWNTKQLVTLTDIKGTQFICVDKYVNRYGEVSRQVICSGIDHGKIIAKDQEKIHRVESSLALYTHLVQKYGDTVVKKSFEELKKSGETCLDGSNIRSQAQKDAYVWIGPGMKVAILTGKIFLYGYSISKVVLVPGVYPTVKHQKKTLCKNEIKKLANVKGDNYRQFQIDIGKIGAVNLAGNKIVFPVVA